MALGTLSRMAWLALAFTLLASVAWAQQDTSSAGLKAELEKLRVLYTEDHPDVQRTKHLLERALKVEAERRQRTGAPEPAASSSVSDSLSSKKAISLPAGTESRHAAEERKKERKSLEEYRKTRKFPSQP